MFISTDMQSSESANQKVSELNRVIKLHESDISSKIDTINDLKAQLAIFEEKEAKMKVSFTSAVFVYFNCYLSFAYRVN